MMRYFGYLLLVFLFSCFSLTSFSSDEIDTILNRHKTFLLKEEIDEDSIKKILNDFNKTQQRWNNIKYGDAQKAEWKVPDHLKNIKTLALCWSNPLSDWYRNSNVYDIIIGGLDNWAQNKYQNPNWWHNEIGIPQLMRDILVLMKDDLPQERLNNYLPILKQYRIAGSGANLVWSADLGLFYGLFTKDFNLVDSAVSAIINEIKISDNDGLKPDFSFQQHGQRLQMYQYGAAFLLDNIRIGWELQKSRWAYPQNKVALLTSMLLEGWQWMARGIYTVPETMDRSSTRVDELNKADVRLFIDLFKDLIPAESAELNALKERQNNVGKSLEGFRNFPYSDFTAYHTEDFSFFLKTISSRTLVSESINNENLKGKLLNSGETYFMRDGKEYFNMMPVWDWEKLPGITAFKGAQRIKRKDFNGSVSDGDIGFISMDFMLVSKDESSSIACKKSWYLYEDYVLCLITNVHMKNIPQAYTILDQSRWRSTITTDKGLFFKDIKYLENLKWIRHNDFVYFTLDKTNDLHLYADTVSGSWYSINRGYSSERLADKVFLPSIVHKPGKSATAYVVAFSGKTKTKRIIRKQPFNIVRNDADCQAVIFSDKRIAVSFFRPGSINLKNITVHVDKACLIIVRKGKIFISDPVHEGGIVNITYNKKKYQVKLPADGTTVFLER